MEGPYLEQLKLEEKKITKNIFNLENLLIKENEKLYKIRKEMNIYNEDIVKECIKKQRRQSIIEA